MGRPIKKTYFKSVGGAGVGGEGVASIAVGGGEANAGYISLPALQISAPELVGGIQAVARAHMAVSGIENFFAGTSGYTPTQVLTLTGGTGTQGTITVTSTGVNSADIGNNRGSGYAPNDVVTVDDGTGTSATVVVLTTRVKSATVSAGGDGYAVDDVIEINDGTSNTLKAQFTVTGIGGGGATGPITTVEPVSTVLGDYSTNPTLLNSATTKRSGTGDDNATLDLVMEVNTIDVVTPGSYTENPTLTNSTTSPVAPATGTGLTVDLTMNINSASVTTGGDYTALPADVTIVGHTGPGGALFNLTYTVLSAEVTTAGSGYVAVPTITENPDGGATYTATLSAVTANAISAMANVTGLGAKAGSIVKQEASRRYLVTTGDGTGQCALVAHSPDAAGQMTMTAKDSAGGTYYVTKLTARRAVIVKGDRDGVQFTTGTDGISVPWVFTPNTAVLNESVEIVSA